jgi:hypothetical protein
MLMPLGSGAVTPAGADALGRRQQEAVRRAASFLEPYDQRDV